MISIIIASADEKLLKDVCQNIENTIGIPFEVISFNNKGGERGICEVYNDGISKARYDILCFMHEDLDIKTLGWGVIVRSIFEANKGLGILGVAGSAYKTYAPSGWDVEGVEAGLRHINYIQAFKRSAQPSVLIKVNPTDTQLAKVACVDGMWFCTRKEVVRKYPFNETLLLGFHGYDLDFCLSAIQDYDIAVTYDILMEHFSEGNFSKEWLEEILKVHEKWAFYLPVCTAEVPEKVLRLMEKRAYKRMVMNMVSFGFNKSGILNLLNNFRVLNKINLMLFLKLCFYILKQKKTDC